MNVRYLVDDVAASIDFYKRHFGFTVGISSPAFADVTRGNLRLLLSGPMRRPVDGTSMRIANGNGDAPSTASKSPGSVSRSSVNTGAPQAPPPWMWAV